MHFPARRSRPSPPIAEIRTQPHSTGARVLVLAEAPRKAALRRKILGWQQVSVGLLSSSAQRSRGRWVHRTDWAWLTLPEHARRCMAAEARQGKVPAVALLWMPVRRVPGSRSEVLTLGPPRHPAFVGLQWRVARFALGSTHFEEPGQDYFFLREYVRPSVKPPTGRRGWREWVLEGPAIE